MGKLMTVEQDPIMGHPAHHSGVRIALCPLKAACKRPHSALSR